MTAMLDTDKVFSGSIPGSYDRYMVPLIFQPYAEDLAQRAATLSPVAVLETAAGSGVVTRALAPRLAPHATYVVTDLNQPMVDYASSRQPPDKRIKWRQADALALPFENAAFDLICCQFGAMFFPDRLSWYREARRVLKSGGHFIFNVWDPGLEQDQRGRIVQSDLLEGQSQGGVAMGIGYALKEAATLAEPCPLGSM